VVALFSSLEVVDALFSLLVPAEVVLHLSSLAVVLRDKKKTKKKKYSNMQRCGVR